MSKYLTADAILDADDTMFFDVECPEWGNPGNPRGVLRVRTLNATERDQWEASMDKDNNKGASRNRMNARAQLVSKVIVDETGSRIFNKPDLVERLGRKNVAPINRIFERVLDASKVTREDLEQLEGNSSAATPDDSVFS